MSETPTKQSILKHYLIRDIRKMRQHYLRHVGLNQKNWYEAYLDMCTIADVFPLDGKLFSDYKCPLDYLFEYPKKAEVNDD